jgi:hypothetical protein
LSSGKCIDETVVSAIELSWGRVYLSARTADLGRFWQRRAPMRRLHPGPPGGWGQLVASQAGSPGANRPSSVDQRSWRFCKPESGPGARGRGVVLVAGGRASARRVWLSGRRARRRNAESACSGDGAGIRRRATSFWPWIQVLRGSVWRGDATVRFPGIGAVLDERARTLEPAGTGLLGIRIPRAAVLESEELRFRRP